MPLLRSTILDTVHEIADFLSRVTTKIAWEPGRVGIRTMLPVAVLVPALVTVTLPPADPVKKPPKIKSRVKDTEIFAFRAANITTPELPPIDDASIWAFKETMSKRKNMLP